MVLPPRECELHRAAGLLRQQRDLCGVGALQPPVEAATDRHRIKDDIRRTQSQRGSGGFARRLGRLGPDPEFEAAILEARGGAPGLDRSMDGRGDLVADLDRQAPSIAAMSPSA